jgi:predicted nucleic acid-binding protein
MLIICDSSPLIALSLCKKLELLDTLFSEVVVPETVYNEINKPGKPEAGNIAVWAREKIRQTGNRQLLQALNLTLDAGESEAIALYWENSADFLLIDEQKGRKIAFQQGIKIIGTVGILLRAKQTGLITAVRPFIDLLRDSPIRISDDLYKKTLDLAKEADNGT